MSSTETGSLMALLCVTFQMKAIAINSEQYYDTDYCYCLFIKLLSSTLNWYALQWNVII